jgi:hypothetical protein
MQHEVKMITLEMIVHRANEVRQYLDGMMAPVKRLVYDNDLVFGVWQDLAEPEGDGTHIIKGRAVFAELVASGQSQNVRWTAIGCIEAEQAIALQRHIGDKFQ